MKKLQKQSALKKEEYCGTICIFPKRKMILKFSGTFVFENNS